MLRDVDKQRLQLDMELLQQRAAALRARPEDWQDKLQTLYAEEEFVPSEDPEQQLYDGVFHRA